MQTEGKNDPLLKVLLCASILLNVFCSVTLWNSRMGSGPHSQGWAHEAAAEAEAVAAVSCSGHGRVFLDSLVVGGRPRRRGFLLRPWARLPRQPCRRRAPACECNTCYGGADCSELSPDCPANVDSGDPMFLEPYWKQHAASSAVVVSGWHRMSYKANGDDYISIGLERHIRRLHDAVGNAVTDGRFIIFGTGSTQLINALVHALSPNNSSTGPARVVASVPFYPMYQAQTDLLDAREYEWEGSTSEWVNASSGNFVEFVTSPNNPDGYLRKSVLRGSSVIHDHCYYWPHYTAIPTPADEDVMLFSNSKISGHAGSRFGWAVIKDRRVYERATKYIQMSSVGVSRDSQLRILKIVKAILAETKEEHDIFEFGYDTMRERWRRLNALISRSIRFSLQQISPRYCTYFQKIREPSPAYGWLKCEMEEDQDCEALLRGEGIITRGGVNFQANARYTRLSLIKSQDDFELLMLKMEALISKESFDYSI